MKESWRQHTQWRLSHKLIGFPRSGGTKWDPQLNPFLPGQPLPCSRGRDLCATGDSLCSVTVQMLHWKRNSRAARPGSPPLCVDKIWKYLVWNLMNSRREPIPENSCGIASTAGIHFPRAGSRHGSILFGRGRGRTKNPHQTKECLNTCNFFSFLIYLFCMTRIMFVCIFHFPSGLCHLHLLILNACVWLSQSGHCYLTKENPSLKCSVLGGT